jgi:hypothetical protein
MYIHPNDIDFINDIINILKNIINGIDFNGICEGICESFYIKYTSLIIKKL